MKSGFLKAVNFYPQFFASLQRKKPGMKRILFLLIGLPFFVAAQDKGPIVEGTSPNLYISHTVVAKENFYSIGRMYNISPKEIAPFNKISMEKGLNPGKLLKIPLNKSNFSQENKKAADEVLVPVYYTVKEKEGLYRIGINNNKLPVAKLKKWNNLQSDEVKIGEALIVGYLKVKKGQSALAGKGPEKIVDTKTVTKVPESQPVIVETAVVKNEAPEKTKPVVADKKEVEIREPEKPKVEEPTVKPITNFGTDFSGGTFKSLFESQTKGNTVESQEGMAGVFKSTSGWKDGKYYCLHNTVPPGTVIKITNTTTGKSIFAKVLDAMPDIKPNAGLVIRLSNAAADELGTGENNFSCTINYSK